MMKGGDEAEKYFSRDFSNERLCLKKKLIIKMNAKRILVNINIISLYIKFIKNIILEMWLLIEVKKKNSFILGTMKPIFSRVEEPWVTYISYDGHVEKLERERERMQY